MIVPDNSSSSKTDFKGHVVSIRNYKYNDNKLYCNVGLETMVFSGEHFMFSTTRV